MDETAETSHVIVQEADESDSEMNLTEAPKALGKCFLKSFFDCVDVYTTSCSESDNNEINEELSVPPKKDWHERLVETLWAYRTTYRTSTQSPPYALVYRVEAVLQLETQIPSLCIAIQEVLSEDENH